jgi:hypothetical protein
MYRRPILCTLYGAVDFLNVLKKGCWGGRGGVLLVHSDIYYVPIGDGRTQTLSLPPPGIEPGSPASQVGTLPKELSRQLILSVVCASHRIAREGSSL